jgi:hypothetical protein
MSTSEVGFPYARAHTHSLTHTHTQRRAVVALAERFLTDPVQVDERHTDQCVRLHSQVDDRHTDQCVRLHSQVDDRHTHNTDPVHVDDTDTILHFDWHVAGSRAWSLAQSGGGGKMWLSLPWPSLERIPLTRRSCDDDISDGTWSPARAARPRQSRECPPLSCSPAVLAHLVSAYEYEYAPKPAVLAH